VDELALVVERACRETELRRELARLRADAGAGARARLIGRSPPMQRLFELVERVAPTRATVLVTGETGTGKELVARAVHDLSDRARRPFVAVNCSALPETLLESELFGHVKGAFTGALRDHKGLFQAAASGTLFLDEIGDMPLTLQVKLLRVLQEREVRPVGSAQSVKMDVRVISATHRDLRAEIAAGRFREDLYYRLNVVSLTLPPLAARREDIPLLANHFLTHFWERHRQPGEATPRITEAALDFLRSRPWRGNVRELQNVVEQLAVLAEPGQGVQPDDVPLYDDAAPAPATATGLPISIMTESFHLAKEKLVAHFEKEYLTQLIARAGSNMSKAARLASIDRTTLYRLMEKHGFRRDEFGGAVDE